MAASPHGVCTRPALLPCCAGRAIDADALMASSAEAFHPRVARYFEALDTSPAAADSVLR